MKYIDTHCHLYSEEFKDDYEVELQKALGAGVEAIVLPAIDADSHNALFSLAEKFPNFYPLIGLHPTSVNNEYRKELDLVERLLADKKVYGIGEVGMDLYWSKEFEREQRDAFTYQIELAITHDLPIAIHAREAFSEILDVFEAFKGRPVRGVFHAFTGDVETYKKIDALGDFVVGIGGIVTFKNSGLAGVVKEIPLSRMILETDSPYLAPTPHRGKRNVPAYIPVIASKIAEEKQISIAEVARTTTETAKKLFNIPQ